jgi:hypothetical protein
MDDYIQDIFFKDDKEILRVTGNRYINTDEEKHKVLDEIITELLKLS